MTPYCFVITVVIFHACWCHFHKTPCVQQHNVFLKGHAVICVWVHSCWVSYKMKSTEGITIFTINTIFMRHLNVISEWNIFLPARFFYLRTYEWRTVAIKSFKSDFFYRLQLFSMKIFQKQINPTVPNLEVHLTVGNTLAWQSKLESWNVHYVHSS